MSSTRKTALLYVLLLILGCSAVAQGPVGWWKLDEGSGSTAIDSSGKGNTGTWFGTPAGSGGTYYVAGKIGPYAGKFDGTPLGAYKNHINLPLLGLVGNVPFSVALWVNPASSSSVEEPFSFTGSEIVRNYPSAGNLTFYNGSVRLTGTFPVINSWHHIVLISNSSHLTFYVDGMQNATATYAATVSNSFYAIGWSGPQSVYGFNGIIDDVRIYNRALSAAEILALYNTTSPCTLALMGAGPC